MFSPRPLLSRLQRTTTRTLHTTLRHASPVANHTPYPPSLLQRSSSRTLPSLASLSSRRRWLTTLPIFLGVLSASALGIFNYQKVNSPIITATLYALRTNPAVRDALGDEVYFGSKWAWIWGSINLVQGRVDVRFRVKGTGQGGLCRFVARRLGGKGGTFKTTEWSLTLDDGRVMHLLEPGAGDPLAGAAV